MSENESEPTGAEQLAQAIRERDEARAEIAKARTAVVMRVEGKDFDFRWRRDETAVDALIRERNEALAEVARLNARLESITAENHSRARREALSLEDWANLRAQLDKWKLKGEP